MKKVIAFTVFICSSTSGFSQITAHGTFLIAAFAKDGIVFGSDTRQTLEINAPEFRDNPKIGYYDNSKKIHLFKNYMVMVVGVAEYYNQNLFTCLSESNKTVKSHQSLTQMLQQLRYYVLKKHPEKQSDFDGSTIIVAGYENDSGKIEILHQGSIKVLLSDWVASNSLNCLFESEYPKNRNYPTVASAIKEEIQTYPKRSGRELEVGGTTMIAVIKPNQPPFFLEKYPQCSEYETIYDVKNLYIEGKIKIHFRSDSIQNRFNNFIQSKSDTIIDFSHIIK